MLASIALHRQASCTSPLPCAHARNDPVHWPVHYCGLLEEGFATEASAGEFWVLEHQQRAAQQCFVQLGFSPTILEKLMLDLLP